MGLPTVTNHITVVRAPSEDELSKRYTEAFEKIRSDGGTISHYEDKVILTTESMISKEQFPYYFVFLHWFK